MKKLLAIVLAVLMLIPSMAMTVSAAVSTPTAPTLTVSSVEDLQPGQTFDVTLTISNNPGLMTLIAELLFDTEMFEHTATVMGSNFIDGVPGPVGIASFSWYRLTGNTANGTVATFSFKVKEEVTPGDYDFKLVITDNDPDNFLDLNEESAQSQFTFVDGVTNIYCDHEYAPVQVEGNDEQHKQYCDMCHDEYMEDHHFGEVNHKTEPDCDDEGEDTYTCADCGYVKSEAVSATGEHSYGDWEKINDDTHRRTCTTCNGVAAVENDVHSWDDGVETTEPGCNTEGEKTYTCSVCHGTKTESISADGNHEYGEWKTDGETQHKRTCTTCDPNGEVAVEYADHGRDAGSETKKTDCDTAGEMTYICPDCGEDIIEAINATGVHTYGEWQKYDEGHHIKYCTTCDSNPDSVTDEHNWDDGEVTKPETCTNPGELTKTCTVCGETKVEPIAPSGDHTASANVLLYINGVEQTGVTKVLTGKPGDDVDYAVLAAWAKEELLKFHNAPSRVEVNEYAGDHTSAPISKLGEDKPDSVIDPCEHTSTIIIDITPYYTISYKDGLNGEIFDQSEEVVLGGAMPAFSKNDARDNYVRTGWDKTWTSAFETSVDANLELIAVWAEDINNNDIPDANETKYTVTYTDGVDTETVFADDVHSNLLVKTDTPAFTGSTERDGYLFTGWTPAVAATIEEGNTSIVYTATWAEDINDNDIPDADETKYTVTYTDGVDTETVFADDVHANLLVKTDTPAFTGSTERNGYVFTGWTPAVAATITEGNTSIVYTATWAEDTNNNGEADNTETKYTVKYTDGVDTETVFEDQEYTNLLINTDTPAFTGETPSRGEDYLWLGWTPAVSEKVTGTVTYVGTWAEDFNHNDIDDATEDKYTVTYADGANGEVFENEVFSNLLPEVATPATTHTAPTRDNYFFTGWDKTIAETVTESVTYTATWAPDFNHNDIDDSTEAHYDVVYTDGVDDEEVFADQSYPVLDGLATPAFVGTPERADYTFLGWDKAIAETVTESATYTAVWVKNSEAFWVDGTPYTTVDDAINAIEDDGTATIIIPDNGTDSYGLNDIAEKTSVKDADISIELTVGDSTVVVDDKALTAIGETEGDVTLTVNEEEAPEGDTLKNATHYTVEISDENGDVDLGEGTVTVTAPVDETVKNPTVFVKNTDGDYEKTDVIYDEANGTLTFVVNGSANYAVAEDPDMENTFTGYVYVTDEFHALIMDGKFMSMYHVDNGHGFCNICQRYFKHDAAVEETEEVEEVEEIEEVNE